MRKEKDLFRLRTILLANGERLPLLCSSLTGEPLYEPLLYALTELRATNKAVNTLRQALRAIQLLQLVLQELDVDLSARLAGGQSLALAEVEAVARAASLTMDELADEDEAPSPMNVFRLEAARARDQARTFDEVAPGTKSIRLHYIRHYLDWLAKSTLLRLDPVKPVFGALRMSSQVVSATLRERMPGTGSRNTENAREGLAPDELARVKQVIAVDSTENPWKGRHNRVRNNLMVRWYQLVGVRRAELLNVRVSDINFQRCEVLVARRPDAPDDPRKEQPLVKTADRSFPVDPELLADTHNYIRTQRRSLPGARKHGYLFVAYPTGRPLSLSAVNLVFQQLRTRDGLPNTLSPHVVRHSWNDAFSDYADKEGLSPEVERKTRARAMGWSETSETAAKYTRRHTRRKSRESLIQMQEKLVKGARDET